MTARAASIGDNFDAVALIYASMSSAVRRRLVARVDYESIARAAFVLYRENEMLRERLRELEALASSWTGTPSRHEPIVRAREVLQVVARAVLPWA